MIEWSVGLSLIGRKGALLTTLLAVLVLTGCSTQYPNRSPVGEVFPSVSGQSLEQDTMNIPEDIAGAPAVLLVGYKQDSQFDIDRWLIGLDMTNTRVAVYELPTIPGLFPRMFSTVINEGMRAGIPKELWKGVVTVYAGGEAVQVFTGNENPNNARALLIDAKGQVVFFDDRGFSVAALNAMRDTLAAL